HPPSIYVARLDAAGTPVAAWAYPAAGEQAAHGIAVAAGGDLVLGGRFLGQLSLGGTATNLSSGIGEDAFVARIDGGDGTGVWASRAGNDAAQRVRALVLDGQGDVRVAGEFEGTVG